jgi:hypothetical protein
LCSTGVPRRCATSRRRPSRKPPRLDEGCRQGSLFAGRTRALAGSSQRLPHPLLSRLGSRRRLGQKTCRLRGLVALRFKIEWYQDQGGDAPVHRWLTKKSSD